MTRRSSVVKRAVDISFSIAMLLGLSPVLVCVAVLVRLKLGRPVLFRQSRPGLNGKPFQIIKFRSMEHVASHRGVCTDAERLTPFGKALRASSLDELPELWNVLRGDMSLVGPRPLLMEYLSIYTTEQARRHHVRPGVTGLAQVSGRNAISWECKLALDIDYVDNRSLALDLAIIWRTVRVAISRRDVSAENHVTAPQFTGTTSGSAHVGHG